MNERLTTENREISLETKEALIRKIRSLAPFENQEVDRFGSFATHFDQGDTYTSIYIPGLAGHIEEGQLFDDGVRVVERETLEDVGRYVIIRTKHYTIHLDDYEAEYSENIKVFDEATGLSVDSGVAPSIEKAIEDYNLNRQYGESPVFTEQRLKEVDALLDSLDPTSRFYY